MTTINEERSVATLFVASYDVHATGEDPDLYGHLSFSDKTCATFHRDSRKGEWNVDGVATDEHRKIALAQLNSEFQVCIGCYQLKHNAAMASESNIPGACKYCVQTYNDTGWFG